MGNTKQELEHPSIHPSNVLSISISRVWN